MIQKKFLFILIMFFLFLIFSCSLKYYPEEYFKKTNGETIVYCAGYYNDGTANHACYWKNSEIIILDSTNTSQANSICIVGDDVYVGGFYNPSSDIACYWENGNKHDLPHTSLSRINSIFVKGGTVYCVGHDYINANQTACFWVNDKKYTLSNGEANEVYVDEGIIIHIAGLTAASNGFYWNSESGNPKGFTYEVNGFFFSNDNIFLALSNGDIYKNDTLLYNVGTQAQSLFVYNDDIYISTTTAGNYAYYINNTKYSLTSPNEVNKIYVYNSTVYTAGQYSGTSTACYWRNTDICTLNTTGNSSIAVDIKAVTKR